MGVSKSEAEASVKADSYFSRMLARIGGVFLAPDSTFRQIITDKIGFWEPLVLVLLLVGIQTAVIASLFYRITAAIADSLRSITGGMFLGFADVFVAIMFVTVIFSALIVWVIVTGIAHLTAKFVFKGQGSFLQLMKLYGYSIIPWSLLILGTVIVSISWAWWPLLIFFHVITTFWIVVLMSAAVKHNYNIDIGKAFISSFIGPMLVWLIMMGVTWAWMWLIINPSVGGFV